MKKMKDTLWIIFIGILIFGSCSSEYHHFILYRIAFKVIIQEF